MPGEKCLLGWDFTCMPMEAWAAWVQAIFSVLAILAAAVLPLWHEKIARERQAAVLRELIRYALIEAESTVGHMMIALKAQTPIDSSERDEWVVICRLFENVAYHEMPIARLLPVVRDAARAANKIKEIYTPLLGNPYGLVREGDLRVVSEQTTILRQCLQDAASTDVTMSRHALDRFRSLPFVGKFLAER